MAKSKNTETLLDHKPKGTSIGRGKFKKSSMNKHKKRQKGKSKNRGQGK